MTNPMIYRDREKSQYISLQFDPEAWSRCGLICGLHSPRTEESKLVYFSLICSGFLDSRTRNECKLNFCDREAVVSG